MENKLNVIIVRELGAKDIMNEIITLFSLLN